MGISDLTPIGDAAHDSPFLTCQIASHNVVHCRECNKYWRLHMQQRCTCERMAVWCQGSVCLFIGQEQAPQWYVQIRELENKHARAVRLTHT